MFYSRLNDEGIFLRNHISTRFVQTSKKVSIFSFNFSFLISAFLAVEVVGSPGQTRHSCQGSVNAYNEKYGYLESRMYYSYYYYRYQRCWFYFYLRSENEERVQFKVSLIFVTEIHLKFGPMFTGETVELGQKLWRPIDSPSSTVWHLVLEKRLLL